MSGSGCHYPQLMLIARQRDIESLCTTLLDALHAILPQHQLRLYVKSAGVDGEFVAVAASHPGDVARLATLTGPEPVVEQHTGGQVITCWPLFINARLTAALVLEGSPVRLSDPLLQCVTELFINQYSLLNASNRDSLTELYNRQAFERMMNKLLAEQNIPRRRNYEPGEYGYFALLDIDHFKTINDRFGHLFGDEVLLHFAQVMLKSFRDCDLLFRYGGEEFAAALCVTDQQQAEEILERFRRKIETYRFPQVGTVTVSIGYTRIKSNQLLPGLTDEADRALYYAKEQGRNMLCNYDALVQQGKLQQSPVTDDIELF